MLRIVRASGGVALDESDDRILHVMREVSESEGILVSPGGAAAFAAAAELRRAGVLDEDDEVVVFNAWTG